VSTTRAFLKRPQRRAKRSAGIALACLLLLAGSDARASEGKSEAIAGAWAGDAVEVRWRSVDRTHYGPDTLVEVSNKIDRSIIIRFEWAPRECRGEPVRLSDEARLAVKRLYSKQFGIDAVLKPGEWDAFVFPRGLSPEVRGESEEGCVSRLELRRVGAGEDADRWELVLPAAPPPARMRE
jgi:hypothetical protein